MPICLVSLVDENRQWFKSCVGVDFQETARDESFCTHTVEQRAPLVVEDARNDMRFVNNRFVTTEPGVRFYAGVPLTLPTGHVLGSLCIVDTQPRTFSREELTLLEDMGQLVMDQIDLHQLAGRVNEVTRLPNRAQFAADMHLACQEFPGASRTLMLLDVMTHVQLQSAVRAVGIAPLESALRSIASMLVQAVPQSVELYHVSDTRFALVMQTADTALAQDTAESIVMRMKAPFQTSGVTAQLEVQAGLVHFPLTSESAEDALRKATSALHKADSDQTPLVWYCADADLPHRRAYSLLRAIPGSLSAGEFRLVYQPKMNLHTGTFTGVEALARWRHPVHGDISPAEFVPLMEKTTFIHDFTEWVLHKALEQLAAWRALGVEVTMAVNVSSRNLQHPHFLQILRNACALHRVHPQNLHLECTENDVIAGSLTGSVLASVREMGVGISLDDFGVGYSNLACLHSLPIQLLKLDQSLIKPIDTDTRALALVRSLIRMGHTLGYRLLAEGVESSDVLDILKTEGCDAVQGYYLSRPLEAPAIPGFLDSAGLGMNRLVQKQASSQLHGPR